MARFGEVEAAWRHHDGLRLGVRDRAPLQPSRVRARIGKDRRAPGQLDEFGNPMAGAHWRIGPLQHERARALRGAGGLGA
ncbi:MAG: hypothetical protein ABSF08_03735 [Candidatus Cybelea sp.]